MGARRNGHVKLSAYGALEQVIASIQSNKLPPTVLVPALKEKLSPLDLQKEFGISGTTNFRGDLLTESNAKLVHQLAYGQPGTRNWGEWEKILMTDPAVAVAVEHTKAQIRDADVEIEPADDSWFSDKQLPVTQANYVRWNLLEALEPQWAEFVQQLCNALIFGFTLHEVVAAQAQHALLPGGSGYKVAKVAERLPVSVHPLGWVEDPDTRDLKYVRQWGPYPGTGQWYEALIPAEKLLLHSWNRRGNNYLGFSAFRSVWYWCKAREQLAKLVPISLVREGAGVPVAYTDKPEASLSTKDHKRLTRFMANIVYHENANLVMPPGWKVEWLYSPASNKGHVMDVYNAIGTIILQQVMAQHLQLGVVGHTGSRSVGDTQSSISDAFTLGVLANIEGAINGVGGRSYTGLVKKLVDWNWGAQPAYPRVRLTLKKAKVEIDKYATAVVGLKQAGAITCWGVDDENDTREHMGLAPVDDETFNAEKAKRDAAAQQLPPAPGDPQTAKAKTERLPNSGAGGASQLAAAEGFTPRRQLRASERFVALGDIAGFFDSAKERFARGAKPLVAKVLMMALPDVRAAMKSGDPSQVASVKLDMSELAAFVSSFVDQARGEGYRQVANEARRQGLKDIAFSALMGKRPDKTVSEDIDDVAESMKHLLVRRMERRLLGQLEDAAIDVQRTGGDPSEAIAEVLSDETDSDNMRGDAGLVTTRAFNLGREEFADQYGDAVESVELSSVLDDGTCTFCESMDGTEFDFQSEGHDSNTPPLRNCEGGSRCRCLLLYNFRSTDGSDDE